MYLDNYYFNYALITHADKPVIFFLHGFMGNIHEFDTTIKLLGDNFSYLIIDIPGHGATQVLGKDDDYTMPKIAASMIKLLDKLNITQCFLVGYSMGGRLALYLTLNFPQYFKKVILESASPGLATESERLARLKSDAQIGSKLSRITSKTEFKNFLFNWYNQTIFGAIKSHPEFYMMLASRWQNQPSELTKSLKFMGTGNQPSLWDKLPENQVPLLLLVGKNDVKFKDINQKMVNLCSVAQLEVINDAAHNIHFENTLVFVEHLQRFFSVA